MKKNNKGFSLIEIVVVLAIMGVIAAFLTPMLFDYMKDSKLRRAQNDVQQIAGAIGKFNIDTGVFPVYASLPLTNTNATLTVLYTTGNDAETPGDFASTGANACSLQKPLEYGATKADTLYNAATDGVKKPQEWKGPYMTDFKADPWGNKYYVAVAGLRPASTQTMASFVISAGPNGIMDTVITQGSSSGTTTAFAVGVDDIAYRIK